MPAALWKLWCPGPGGCDSGPGNRQPAHGQRQWGRERRKQRQCRAQWARACYRRRGKQGMRAVKPRPGMQLSQLIHYKRTTVMERIPWGWFQWNYTPFPYLGSRIWYSMGNISDQAPNVSILYQSSHPFRNIIQKPHGVAKEVHRPQDPGCLTGGVPVKWSRERRKDQPLFISAGWVSQAKRL